MQDDLGDRMKEYEAVSKNFLTKRVPVIIRLDGRNFHSFTKGFNKPFDRVLINTMQATMKYLCENVQGCVFGYTQSDEITLILTDYANINSSAWFDYNVQKMTSVSASMATLAFNNFFADIASMSNKDYSKAIEKGAMFDSRAFNLPKEEVVNCLIWRQKDATRNSIQMAGRAVFPHSQLVNKTNSQIQDMLMAKGINWNDYITPCKRGSACYRVLQQITVPDSRQLIIRNKWLIDEDIPIFTKDREFIEKYI